MILRLRQLCCHPKLILTQAEKFDDPTDLMGNEAEKERGRAVKIKGRTWVEGVGHVFTFAALNSHSCVRSYASMSRASTLIFSSKNID